MPHRHILTGAGIAESRVLGAREGEELSLPSSRDSGAFLSLSPLAAAHPDYAKAESGDYPSLGYVIRGGGVSVYHSGDTYVNPRLVEGLKKMLPLDIAVLPINGGDWERTSQNIIGNMSALDAVKLARTIGTDLVIPAHYDMMPNNSENPGLFAEYMYTLCPEKRFHIFALGEKYRYEKARESTDLFNRE
jgi:L-ascorbate metabolism protein UlaG (beta-lactamase superfamily)